MKLVKGLSEYVMPPLSSLEKSDISVRVKDEDKALTHGGMLSGDGCIDTRTVGVEVIIDADDVADYIEQTDELKRYAYRKDQKLFITDTRYINVASLSKFQEKYYKGFYMVKAVIDLTFLAIDPFIYQDGLETETQTVTESPTEFTVNNPGNVDTPVVITITANASCTAINITNVTDNNRQFDYNDVQMIEDEILVVDSINGTVYRGETNTINNFGGTFLNLLPGENVLQYTGGNCTIQIDFPVRWL